VKDEIIMNIRNLQKEDEVTFNSTFTPYLRLLKGSHLHVLMYLALSKNSGVIRPNLDEICKGTGYTINAVLKSLAHLCGMSTPDGGRVVVKGKRMNGGRHGRNQYLVFPTPQEIKDFGSQES
jgi:hypothetical protein